MSHTLIVGVINTVILAVLSIATAHAHHSHSNLDLKNIQQHRGTVVKYIWRMPHVYIKVNAPNSSGKIVEYRVEMLNPPALLARGWDKNSFNTGDTIIWAGAADRNPNRYYSGLSWAEKPSGERLSMDMSGDVVPEKTAPSTDFSGLWKRDLRGEKGHYNPPKGWSLTPKGQTLVANFHESQNPQTDCQNPGPPKATLLPYPINISRPADETIQMEYELRDIVRTIYLNKNKQPGEPSPWGHSIGWFEGDQLVVETTNFIDDRWGIHTGIDSSNQKHLIERYQLIDGGLSLKVEMQVTDPVYLAEPATIVHYMKKTADREVLQIPCSMESANFFLETN